MTNLDSILKSKDITLLTKGRLIKAMVYRCELDHKEGWMHRIDAADYGAREDSWESLGLQGDQTSQS